MRNDTSLESSYALLLESAKKSPKNELSNVSRFKPALNLNRVLADLNSGSNSLNSISECLWFIFRKPHKCLNQF